MTKERTALVDGLYTGRRTSAEPPGLGAEAMAQIELEDALEMQLAVLNRFTAAGELLGGWKVGLTSGNARDRMGVDFRPFGYVLRSRILDSGSTVQRASILNCRIEPELCLIVGSALSGDSVDAVEAKAAVRAVCGHAVQVLAAVGRQAARG